MILRLVLFFKPCKLTLFNLKQTIKHKTFVQKRRHPLEKKKPIKLMLRGALFKSS